MKATYEKGIAKIRRLDIKQRKLEREADLIHSTSAFCQAPPIYHRTLDKIIEIQLRKGKIWNEEIRNYLIPPKKRRTFWQRAIELNLPVNRYGIESHLDFYAEDIERCLA